MASSNRSPSQSTLHREPLDLTDARSADATEQREPLDGTERRQKDDRQRGGTATSEKPELPDGTERRQKNDLKRGGSADGTGLRRDQAPGPGGGIARAASRLLVSSTGDSRSWLRQVGTLVPLFVISALAAGAAALQQLGYDATTIASWSPLPCPLQSIAAIACPSCGMTRSIVVAAGGDWIAAVAFHPLGPAGLLAGLGGCALFAFEQGRTIIRESLHRVPTSVLVAALSAYVLWGFAIR